MSELISTRRPNNDEELCRYVLERITITIITTRTPASLLPADEITRIHSSSFTFREVSEHLSTVFLVLSWSLLSIITCNTSPQWRSQLSIALQSLYPLSTTPFSLGKLTRQEPCATWQ